jgi:hypothetical protein
MVNIRAACPRFSELIELEKWFEISIPRSAITSSEKREGGRPSWVLMPAEWILHFSGAESSALTLARMIPSAIGERQILAVQTKRTE